MKLKPLDNRVVIKQLEAEERTTGGIILPETAKEKPQVGKITAVGPGKLLDDGKRSKMNVKKKDLEKVIKILPAMMKPTVSTLSDDKWCDVDTVIEEKVVRVLIPRLKKAGAQGIVEYPLNKVIE